MSHVSLLCCVAGHLLLLAKTVKFKSNSFVLSSYFGCVSVLLAWSCDCKQNSDHIRCYFCTKEKQPKKIIL